MQIKISELKLIVENIFNSEESQIYISQKFEDWLLHAKGIDVLDAQEIISDNIEKLTHYINSIIEDHNKELTHPKYTFCTYNNDILFRTSFLENQTDRDFIEFKICWRDKMYDLLKKINWREFELLSKIILEINGLTNVKITRASKDQGLDFYGIFKMKRYQTKPRFLNEVELKIIGQVKHSDQNNKVNHQKISSFGTEINRLRRNQPPNYFTSLDESFYSLQLPIAGLFITNTLVLPKAESFSKDYGIIIWNGKQIAEDLSNQVFVNQIIDSSNQLSVTNLQKILKCLNV